MRKLDMRITRCIGISVLAAAFTLLLVGSALAQGNFTGDVKLIVDETPLDLSGTQYDHRLVDRYIGKGFQAVDVQLRGWRMTYKFERFGPIDSHIEVLSARIDYVSYDPNTGRVQFFVRTDFYDDPIMNCGLSGCDSFDFEPPARDNPYPDLEEPQDEFYWCVRYAIFALR